MNRVLSKEEILKYKKFLFEEENLSDEELMGTPLNRQDILKACKDAKELDFKYLSYCPNCYESFFGASGLDLEKHILNKCCICNYEKVRVYDAKTSKRLV